MKDTSIRTGVLLGCIMLAIITRVVMPPLYGHPVNFSPIGAIALFCGAYFSNRWTSVAITLASLWVSDLFINAMYLGGFVPFYEGFYWQYATFALITFIGGVVGRNVKPAMVVGGSLAASILFFTVSNFGVWMSGLMYPVTAEGLAACYIAAIPFFGGTLAGDLFYSVLLFGGFELMKRRLPALAVAN